MRGPISTCFFTCSIARSPLNATAPGTAAGLTSSARFEVATRTLGAFSFFGQPVNTSDKVRRHKAFAKSFRRARERKRFGSNLGIKRKVHRNRDKTQNREESLPTWKNELVFGVRGPVTALVVCDLSQPS